MVIHLGRNPKNGGSPPRERKLKINPIFKVGLKLNDDNNCLR